MLWLLKRLFAGLEGRKAVLMAAVAVICPPWIFYMQCTMTEAMLMFTYLLVCALFVRFLEKPGALSACFLAAALVYLYTIHMRCIGTAAAGALTLFIWLVKTGDQKRRRSVMTACAFLVLLFLAALLVKSGVTSRLYGAASAETLSYNDYSGQWEKLLSVFSAKGLQAFLAGAAAKLLYLGASTFGLAYWGLWSMGRRALLLCERALEAGGSREPGRADLAVSLSFRDGADPGHRFLYDRKRG